MPIIILLLFLSMLTQGDLAKLAALNFGSSLDENLWRLGAHSELCEPKKLQIIAKMRQKTCCNAGFLHQHFSHTNFARFPQAQYRCVTRDNGNMFFSLDRIHLFIFHEKDYRLIMIDGGSDIKKAFEDHHCVAGINGGYFGADKKRSPLGIVRHEGRTLHGRILDGSFTVSGIVYDTGKSVMLQRSKKLSTPVAQMREAIQAGPFLLEKGKVVSGLNKKGHSPRSFIATDGNGLWCIGQSSPMTLEALAQWLQSESFQKHFPARLALNLDGGSSSGFYSAKAKKYIAPLRPIRYCIGVTPR